MKKIFKNIFWGLGCQLIILAMGIILPRVILVSFGSEINGITATITQVFAYIALLEAGIGNASLNCLYRFISKDDRGGISETVAATKRYFRGIIPVYAVCVAVFALAFPWWAKTDVPASTIRMIILVQGVGGIVNFYFSNTLQQLLLADGRNYILSGLNLMVKTISTGVQIVLITIGFDIVSVQLSLLAAYVLKAVIINVYARKKYPWLRKVEKADLKLLEQRNSFLVHEIAGVIFQSTGVLVTSIFCSITEASVYSIYSMVYVALNGIFTILFSGIDFKLGTEYHRDIEKYKKLHDTYETLYSCFVFAMISAAFVVILPFVKLYTSGVTDAEYIRPILPILFSLVQLLLCGKAVSAKLIVIAGRAKETIPNAIAEMSINIVASLIFVNIFGMPGVLMGTVLSLLYRLNDVIIYSNKKILGRNPVAAYKTLLINLLLFAGVVTFTHFVPLPITNYLSFALYGCCAAAAMFVLYFGIHFIVSKPVRELFVYIFNRKIIRKRK